MRNYLLLTTLAVVLLGCGDTKNVTRLEGGGMPLPKVGYDAVYNYHVTDNTGLDESGSGLPLMCYIAKHVSGASMDFCGFEVFVGEDFTNFDTDTYYVPSFFGTYEVTVEGSGDVSGAELHVHGKLPSWDFEYDRYYHIEFLGDLPIPE